MGMSMPMGAGEPDADDRGRGGPKGKKAAQAAAIMQLLALIAQHSGGGQGAPQPMLGGGGPGPMLG